MSETVIDSLYFANQAKKCRWLADRADANTAKSLRELADEYEANAMKLDDTARHERGTP